MPRSLIGSILWIMGTLGFLFFTYHSALWLTGDVLLSFSAVGGAVTMCVVEEQFFMRGVTRKDRWIISVASGILLGCLLYVGIAG